jgi:hypothetical protein
MPRIDCPSGFAFEARKWKLADMESLADRAESSSAGDEMLVDAVSRTWVQTLDPGPYPYIQSGKVAVPWERVIDQDILWGLFRVRAASFPSYPDRRLTGEHYQFDVTCQACKPQHTFAARVRLCDLKVRPLPEVSKKLLAEGKPFTVTALDGRLITFHLPSLERGRALSQHLARFKPKKKAKPSDILAAQAESIAGLKHQDIASRARYFGQLDIDEYTFLRDTMSRVGANIITKVDATCDVCGTTREVVLPLRPGFFMPADPMEEAPDEEKEPTGATEQEEAMEPLFSSESSSPPGTAMDAGSLG